VVSGFGLASVYIAPLSQYLLGVWGLQNAMLFFGIAFLAVVCGLSMVLVNPPAGYSPGGVAAGANQTAPPVQKVLNSITTRAGVVAKAGQMPPAVQSQSDHKPSEMMKTGTFYILWLIYFIGSGAGLMVIGSVAGMAKQSMGTMAFLVVAILAVGNAGGRIVAGLLSDKIGRRATLSVMLAFQCILMLIAIPVVGSERSSAVILVLLATFIGFNYGTNLSLFPSFTKDLWGLKNFGINYGIVFTAWGVGGFVMGRMSQMLQASYGSYTYSFLTAAILLIVGVFLTFSLKGKEARDTFIKKEVALSYGESR
jgi:OFA family oxalate/formate antiporter-like MFS transporter